MQDLRVVAIQSELHWEDCNANLTMFSEKINTVDRCDLIVLPEMFNSGFTMHPENVAETMEGKTVDWMVGIACAKNTSICGSLVIEDEGKYYNRLVYCFSDGTIQFYDKIHLFGLAGEDKVYTAGTENIIIKDKGWKIMLQTCYDLRFPKLFNNRMINDVARYDILLNVANWPEKRVSHWNALSQARAIENQCYFIGVNRVGIDNNNLNYSGECKIIDGLGELIISTLPSENTILESVLSKDKLTRLRENLPFLKDV